MKEKTITFSSSHTEPGDCQLIVAMTGSKEFIKERLKQLLEECNDSYGKCRQGIASCHNGTIDVITEVWDGKRY